MDFCYNKSMGNGTIASKFRLTTKVQSNQSNLRTPLLAKKDVPKVSQNSIPHEEQQPRKILPARPTHIVVGEKAATSEVVESTTSHHPSNCNRCYRLKKKCTRTYPKCSHCERTRSVCEYVDRSKKRRKTDDGPVTAAATTTTTTTNVATVVAPVTAATTTVAATADVHAPVVTHIVTPTSNTTANYPGENSINWKPMSVSSLLVETSDEQMKKREMSKRKKVPTAALASSARRAREVEKDSIVDKINFKSIKGPIISNLKEEFITIKRMPDANLPMVFAMNYFENFGQKYPFINKVEFMKSLDNIDFSKDSIVNLDIYLLLSIGCILHDIKCSSEDFMLYFKTKSVESVIDVLDLSFTTFNPDDLHLLLLLCLCAVTSLNMDLTWNLVGMLNRAVLKFELFKKINDDDNDIIVERIFWSIHNLDKELSLLMKKPSQFPKYSYFDKKSIVKPLFEDENLSLVNSYLALGRYQDSLVDSILKNSREKLTQISSDLGVWVGAITKDISLKFVSEPFLQDLIPFANIQSYYLQAEIDQISTTKSFQFPSQFTFYSFTLLISASDKSVGSEKKPNTKLAIAASGFWYLQLFNIIRYSITCLSYFIESGTNEVKLKVVEFQGFLQQAVNLLKYIRGNKTLRCLQGYRKLDEHVNKLISTLDNLSIKLLGFDCTDSLAMLNLLKTINEEVKLKL
ncbi:hypothetical protein KGF56_000886 [Candida oxycetoniae]|uniref:Zn(2)-C6 fungal-type domain-containing protein n=1 Tax=Candida oxycetoniae TaxID=497107 RepID=A0AAI9T1N2_9ASCO|nr:uncharacterized protein KGF56_000886 [Candida oxycetoniae]KAI3406405.2 hypothetical protein KGF56_000886 [Candida oxycetoniae]